MIFQEKYFSCYTLLTDQGSLSGLPLIEMRVLQLFPKLWHHKFWNLPYLFKASCFCTKLKNQEKKLSILRTKRAFKVK